MEYYKKKLSRTEKQFYENILETLSNQNDSVSGPGITDPDTLIRICNAVKYDHPELFYVNYGRLSYILYSDKIIYQPMYLYNAEEIKSKRKKLNEAMKSVLHFVKNRHPQSVYEACGAVHDYFARSCSYQYEALDDATKYPAAYSAEGPLLHHKAVCQGITLAVNSVCQQLGIKTIGVRGHSFFSDPSKWESHAWNMIMMDDYNAHMDVTWDMNHTHEGWPVRYDYFFLPDIEMMRDHQYLGYPVAKCTNASYMEKTERCIGSSEKLEEYIKHSICSDGNKRQDGIYWLYFKITDHSKKTDEIIQETSNLIRKYSNQSYKYEYYYSNAQYIFAYKIRFGRAVDQI